MLFRNIKASQDKECDEALIALSTGKTEALSVIYRTYGRIIYSVAFQILNIPEDAEDTLQDVM